MKICPYTSLKPYTIRLSLPLCCEAEVPACLAERSRPHNIGARRSRPGTTRWRAKWRPREECELLKRRVLIVEDHPMYRQGLRRMLEETGRFAVVGEAQNGHEAIHQADIHHPELMLIDVQLPGVTGLKVARVLRKQHPTAKIVILSMHIDDERLFEAIRAGAV